MRINCNLTIPNSSIRAVLISFPTIVGPVRHPIAPGVFSNASSTLDLFCLIAAFIEIEFIEVVQHGWASYLIVTELLPSELLTEKPESFCKLGICGVWL